MRHIGYIYCISSIYEVQEQAKIVYGDRGQTKSYFEEGNDQEGK